MYMSFKFIKSYFKQHKIFRNIDNICSHIARMYENFA